MMNLLQNRHFGMRHETTRNHKCYSWIRRQGQKGVERRSPALSVSFELFRNRPPSGRFWGVEIRGRLAGYWSSYLKHLQHFVAVVVDDLHCEFACFRLVERLASSAVQTTPGGFVDLRP